MFSFEANSHQFWTVFFTKLLPISAKFVFGMLIMMLHQKTQKEKTVQSCHSTIVVCKEGHLTPPCCSHVASFEISKFNSYCVCFAEGVFIRGKKMVATMPRSRIRMQPMRRLKHTSKRVHFCFWEGGAREGEDGDFLILMFPSYFQPVLTCSKWCSSGF